MNDICRDDPEWEKQLASLRVAEQAAKARLAVEREEIKAPAPIAFGLKTPSPESMARAEAHWAQESAKEKNWGQDASARRSAVASRKLPPAFAWASFDGEDADRLAAPEQAISRARMAQGASRIVFVGPAASGKTSLAAALLRARYVATGCKFLFEPAWRVAQARSRHPLGAGEPDVVQEALRTELFVLDDFGNEKPNPTSAVEDIIFERHWQALTTWVTTHLNPDQVSARYGDGIARRIFERAVIIDCGAGLSGGAR
jgi:DNA replication protein DnaC